MSLNVTQIQIIKIGLLKLREALHESTEDLHFQRRISDDAEMVRLVDVVQTLAGSVDDFAQTLQSALGFPVVAEEREEVGARG